MGFWIRYVIFLIYFQGIDSLNCPYKCTECQEKITYSEVSKVQCIACEEFFILNGSSTQCISTCTDNTFFDENSGDCQASCTSSLHFADPNLLACVPISTCPSIKQSGQVIPSSISSSKLEIIALNAIQNAIYFSIIFKNANT